MAWWNPGAAVAYRVQAAPVLHAERGPGAVQDADTRPRLGLRFPRRHRHRRVLRLGAAPQDRCDRTAPAAHPARRGLRHAAPVLLARTKPMAHPTRIRGLWRSARQVPGRMPLRIKLIAAVLALVTAALAVISIAGIAVLHRYLLHQAGPELATAAQTAHVPHWVEGYFATGHTLPRGG